MAVVSWPDWPGFVKGIEVTVIDLLSVAILLSLPPARNSLPFKGAMAIYFISTLLSVFQASVPTAALFYSFQLLRAFLFFATVAKACADERVPLAFLKGIAIGLCFQACTAIWQRFGLGELQVVGTIGHQNGLGMVSFFAVFPFLSLLLAGKRGWEQITVPISGAIIAVLTVSRATLGLEVVGYAMVFVISLARRWTAKKAGFAALAFFAVLALIPFALQAMETRFTLNPETDYDERAAFESAAANMLANHPFGVGANHYVIVANTQGYNERAGVVPTAGSLSATVHNVYLLVAAEGGYIGLITFLNMLFWPTLLALRSGWKARRDLKGDLLIGLGISLVIVYAHSLFEWIFVTYFFQYLFAATLGLIAGLVQQVRTGTVPLHGIVANNRRLHQAK